MKIPLQPVIVSYTNNDNSSCSCQGQCAEAKTFGSPVAVAEGGVFALPSLYPDTSSHLRTQADVTDHLWQVQVNYVSCVMRSSVHGTKAPRAGFNTDIAATGHREVKHLTAFTSPVFQGPSYSLSSLTQQLLFVLTLLWNNEYKTRGGGELCAVLESSPAVKDAVFSLQLFQFTISNVYFTQNESKPYMIGVFMMRHQLIQVDCLPGGTEY